LFCFFVFVSTLLEDKWLEGGVERGVPPWMMPWRPPKEDHPHRWLHPQHFVVISVGGC
jgi:hypothetical protein